MYYFDPYIHCYDYVKLNLTKAFYLLFCLILQVFPCLSFQPIAFRLSESLTASKENLVKLYIMKIL